jgi:hypothetical protein
MYCEKKQDTWDEFLQQVMMAYRSSVHKSTSRTPNAMVFGREVTLPLQAVIGQPMESDYESDQSNYDDYLHNLKKILKEIHGIARNNLKQAAVYQKRHYDLKAKKRLFKKGQPVWTYEPARKAGICNKLTSPWKGPFIIEKQIDDVTYRVKKSARQPSRIYHVDRLVLYQGRNIPSWAARFMKNQLNCIQVSRHIKDIGQQPIHKEDASKIRDISQNDLELA